MSNNIFRALAVLALLLPASALADTGRPVPELNPASASSAIGVLIGAGFLLRDRFLKR